MNRLLKILLALGIFYSPSLFAGLLEQMPEEMRIAADLPAEELLKYNESASILKVVCALSLDTAPDCQKVKTIDYILKFELLRRSSVEEAIQLLNKKRSEMTEKQVRDAEEIIFDFGTKKERNQVAF